jgi:hypothetical protein
VLRVGLGTRDDVGSPAFMAPECLQYKDTNDERGLANYSATADVYVYSFKGSNMSAIGAAGAGAWLGGFSAPSSNAGPSGCWMTHWV